MVKDEDMTNLTEKELAAWARVRVRMLIARLIVLTVRGERL